MQYKKQLEKLGVQENELTPKIKSMINELSEAVQEREELENDLREENYENEDERNEMNVALVEIDELIESSDSEISNRIVQFAKGKQSRVVKNPQPKPSEVKTTEEEKKPVVPQPASTNTQKEKEPVVPQSASTSSQVEKKSGGGGLFLGILGVAALVLTFGSVNIFSGDD